MISSFLVTFRETLEAALIVGIIAGFLIRIGRREYLVHVLAGVFAGIAASAAGAWLFDRLAGGFDGRAEEIFEGATMLVGAMLLTTMILWMHKQAGIARRLEEKVERHVKATHALGVFALVFVSILREGVETIIFLNAARNLDDGAHHLEGAGVGIVVAVFVGVGAYWGSHRLNLRYFFRVTTVLLMLFAAGLVAHGIHELQEAGVIPYAVKEIYNLNPAPLTDGTFPALHEKGTVGVFLKGLFGYNGNPSLLEAIAWIAYMGGFSAALLRSHAKTERMEANTSREEPES